MIISKKKKKKNLNTKKIIKKSKTWQLNLAKYRRPVTYAVRIFTVRAMLSKSKKHADNSRHQ